MGLGGLDLLGQEPWSLEPHHFYSVSWQAGSICCAMIKSASCVPSHISHFTDYFKLPLLFSRTRAITCLEVTDPHMPWENVLVCAQAAVWTCADPVFQGPHYVFPYLSRVHRPQLINPVYFYLGYAILLYFAFIFFPMVIFSWLSQSNRWLSRVHHEKCWAGWIINWNQDCQEKHQ